MSHLRFIERTGEVDEFGGVGPIRKILQEMRENYKTKEWEWVDIPVYTLEEQAEHAATD